MTDMLDRIAKAMRTYSVHTVRIPEGVTWWILDHSDTPHANVDDEARAHDECDRLNALAVLEAMREPPHEVFDNVLGGDALKWAPGIWIETIDSLLK